MIYGGFHSAYLRLPCLCLDYEMCLNEYPPEKSTKHTPDPEGTADGVRTDFITGRVCSGVLSEPASLKSSQSTELLSHARASKQL